MRGTPDAASSAHSRTLYTSTALVAAALLGCCATRNHDSPASAAFVSEWNHAHYDIRSRVIDVHSHTFNSRCLPIDGIARARKRDLLPWFGLFIPDSTLDEFARVLWEITRFNESSSDDRRVSSLMEQLSSQSTPLKNKEAALSTLVHQTYNRLKLEQGSAPNISERLFTTVLENLGRRFSEHKSSLSESGELTDAIFRFLAVLMSDSKRTYQMMTKAYPLTNLFVHEMHDMRATFARQSTVYQNGQEILQPRESKAFDQLGHPFYYAQLQRARELEAIAKGHLITFTAWDPYRSKGGDSNHPESLALVQTALRQGAVGVKFYPPFGYRPAGNFFPVAPSGWFSKSLKQQWNSRFAGWRPCDLDLVNEQLFAWCEKTGTPIFTHSHTGEFRASGEKYYGECADPRAWSSVLRRHPKLRLCFGHAGGIADWYGIDDSGSSTAPSSKGWGDAVMKFCREYQNVYCEVGIHEEIVQPANAERLYAVLSRELARPCTFDGASGLTFGDKIMYGTDWFMPMKVSPDRFVDAWQRMFSLKNTKAYHDRFFAENAVRYLKLAR